MSTLTKILIVLLTLSSIALSAIVVVYVANADNYKQMSSEYKQEMNSAVKLSNDKVQQFDKYKNQHEAKRSDLNEQVAALKLRIDDFDKQVVALERRKAELLEEVSGMTKTIETTAQTAEQQRRQFDKAFEELKDVKQEKIELTKELQETTDRLMENIAVNQNLNIQIKQLTEQKAKLQNQVDELLQKSGRRTPELEPVTPGRTPAEPTIPKVPAKEIGLSGLITNVQGSVVEISLGKVDGVRDSMRFHVTRGDKFIRDIIIISVDTEKAVGVLDIGSEVPQTDDTVATNF